MKKLFIAIAAALMTVSTANAQRFGLTVGLNESKIANEDVDNLTGFNAGIKVDGSLAETKLGDFFMEGSLLFSRQGYHYEYSTPISSYKYDEKLSYLQLPIYFGHNFNIVDNFSIAPKFGVYFGCGLTGKRDSEGNVLGIGGSSDDDDFNPFADYEDNGGDNYKRFDFGINAGLNFDFFKHLQLSLGYQWGCVEFTDYVDDAKNRNFYLNVAYMF